MKQLPVANSLSWQTIPVTGRASLFEKVSLSPLDSRQDNQTMSHVTTAECLTAGEQLSLERLTKSGSKVEKLDRNLINHHSVALDFLTVEGLWRALQSRVDKTYARQNVKVELQGISKHGLHLGNALDIIRSGLYQHASTTEYPSPGGEPIAALIFPLASLMHLRRMSRCCTAYLKSLQ